MDPTLAADAGWTPGQLTLPRVRLTSESSIRSMLLLLAATAALLAIVFSGIGVLALVERGPREAFWLLGSLAFAALVAVPLAAAGRSYRESWVVDNPGRRLQWSHQVWGLEWCARSLRFDDVAATGVSGTEIPGNFAGFRHAPVLALKDGTLVTLGEHELGNFSRACQRAEALAAHLSVAYVPGSELGTLSVEGRLADDRPALATVARSTDLGGGPARVAFACLGLVFLLFLASMLLAHRLQRLFG